MGCMQSSIIQYTDISNDEAKQIPQIFRDVSKYHSSPGISYWYDSCKVKEGVIPLMIGGKEYNGEYVCISKYGFYPSEIDRTTQDSYSFLNSTFTINGEKKNGIFMGVFDGHGEFGGECSSYCKSFIEEHIAEEAVLEKPQDVSSFLVSSLKDCNKCMHDKKYEGGFDDSNSGTTAVCVSIIDDEVVCVNVGDSRCMAGYCTKNNQVIPIPLSIDQNPIREDERKRVEACGAEVSTIAEKLPSNSIHLPSGQFSPEDPPRIYLKDCGFPGAAFSRSIGDSVAESVGVIAEGEVISKKLQEGVNHIIVASDGLWNFCIPEEIVCKICYATDLGKTGMSIVLSTFQRWIQLYGSSDDITLLILRLPSLDPELNKECEDWSSVSLQKEQVFN